MNVQADHLATDYLDNYAEPSKIIPFIPTVQANITINGETITRRFANRLRLAASSPDMRSQSTYRSQQLDRTHIPIHSLGRTRQSASHTRTQHQNIHNQICAWLNTYQPTRKHMKRIGEAESEQCPSCHNNTKTSWHILSCENRTEWRNTLYKNLSDVLYINKTQPDLAIILMQGIREKL